jgi:hypothetical protein
MSLGLTIVGDDLVRGGNTLPPLFAGRPPADHFRRLLMNTRPRSPAQAWATLIGWTLVVAGAIGFAYSSSFGSPGHTRDVLGVLSVNGFHNLVHIASGALGIVMARSWSSARTYCFILAAAYTVVAIWGFALGNGAAILSIVPVNTEDNVLHALIALVSLALGFGSASVPAPSSHDAGRTIRYN